MAEFDILGTTFLVHPFGRLMSSDIQIRIQGSTDLREALIGVGEMQTGLVKLHVLSRTISGDVYVSRGRHIVWASTPVNRGMQALLSLLSVKATGFEASPSSGVPCAAHELLKISLLDLVENCALVVQQIRDTLSVVSMTALHNPEEITLQNQDARLSLGDAESPQSQLAPAPLPTEIVDLSALNGKQLSQLLRSEVDALRAARAASGEPSLPLGFSLAAKEPSLPSGFNLFQNEPSLPPGFGPGGDGAASKNNAAATLSENPASGQQTPESCEPTEFTKGYAKTYINESARKPKVEEDAPEQDILSRMNEVINTKGIDEAPRSPSQPSLEPVAPEPEPVGPITPTSDFSLDGQAYLRDKAADLFHEQKMRHLLPLGPEDDSKKLIDVDTQDAPDKRAVRMVKFQRLDKSIPVGALVLSGIVVIAVPMLGFGIMHWSQIKNGTEGADVASAQMIADESLDDRAKRDQPQEPFRMPSGTTGPFAASATSVEKTEVDPAKKDLIEVNDQLKRAQQLMSAGNNLEAAQIYSSALSKFPNYLWIRLSAIKAFMAIGKYAEARTLCLAGMSLSLNPTEKQALERVLATIPAG